MGTARKLNQVDPRSETPFCDAHAQLLPPGQGRYATYVLQIEDARKLERRVRDLEKRLGLPHTTHQQQEPMTSEQQAIYMSSLRKRLGIERST